MEVNEEHNNDDLQIQNLSDDEELYQSGVDYCNQAEETKPVTIKNTSQNSLEVSQSSIDRSHDISEADDESSDNSDFVVTKEKIFEKTTTIRKVIRRNISTDSGSENENNDLNAEIKSRGLDNIDNKGSNKSSNKRGNDKHIKSKSLNGNSGDKANKNSRLNSAPGSDRNNRFGRNNKFNYGNMYDRYCKNKNDEDKKNIKDRGLRYSSRSQSRGRSRGRKYTGDSEDEDIIRDPKVQEELDKIEIERRRIIAGDISVHSTDDENEGNDDKKKTKKGSKKVSSNGMKSTVSTNGGKSTKLSKSKKKGTKKKSLKNNYRAFVSTKPSCNRYMANMWNNYVYSIHKMNILNIKKTVDNDAPKKYAHIDQKLKAKLMKKEKEDEIRKNNQNILNRMIYQGKNNVGTSNLDDNNDVIEPVFRSLHADQNRRLENEMNRESRTLLKRLKEKKPYCSVEQWKKDRLITEVYLRNISSYPENYPIRQKSQPRHVPPIKKNENEELKREKSPLEGTGINYSGGKLRGTRTRTAGSCNVRKNNRLNDNSRVSGLNGKGTKKSKYRTMSESTRQSYKLDTSINQNQVDRLYLEQKKNGKLYRVPENDTTTAFDRVLNNYEKVDSDIKDNNIKKSMNSNDDINYNKDIEGDISQITENISEKLSVTENNLPVEEIPITEIDRK
ncbi:hypothetical protein LY90DRAFT_671456 [Neocallimastix californiae]|uniref:Uncharacterized protein n=1 Tax=Neocallimastix californiae TaxID=1754190 RepID=A0A1Y2CFJ3_9FUNG|nr:hypothetical protein LY90DRAFT_671456 [Neocallimastix californiae]|eukprot:ORY45792.1 hypothetical protein LY90DRAFT_671456 [Neocallimastix californiae]